MIKNLLMLIIVSLPAAQAIANEAFLACPTAILGSCSSPQMTSTCMDAIANTVPVEVLQSQCLSSGNGYNYSATPCSNSGVVANCALSMGGYQAVILRFYAPMTAAQATMICNQNKGMICQ